MSSSNVPRTECHLYKVGTDLEIKALVDRMVLRGWAKRTRPLTEAEQDNIKQSMEPATVVEVEVVKPLDDLTIARDEIVARRRAKL